MVAIDIPGYLVQRTIGVGGMASVYLAIQLSLDREVALKVMAPALAADPSFSKRFLQEARMLASLAHPNIVQVYDVGVTPAHLNYFSMQHLPRGDFALRVRAGIGERDLARVLEGVANALGYAHQRGYVHRDVAPGNILFDANDTPVLTDFGIARAINQSARSTSAGISIGTSHYMSPEQARGSDVDARSDIYALGVLAWFGLVGKPPYDGADGFAVSYAHVFEPIPRLPERHAHWQPLIDAALAKTPEERFPSTDAFNAALASITMAAAVVPLVTAPEASAEGYEQAAIDPAQVTEPERHAPAMRVETPVSAVPSAGKAWLPWGIGLIGVLMLLLLGFALLGGNTRRPGAADDATPSVEAAPASVNQTAKRSALPSSEQSPPRPVESMPDSAPTPVAEEPIDPALVPTVIDPVLEMVGKARVDLANQRLTNPPGNNAFERFSLALRIDPASKSARQGVLDIARAYMDLAEKSWNAGRLAEFGDFLDKAVMVASSLTPTDADIIAAASTRRRSALKALTMIAETAASAWDKSGARAAYENVLLIDPDNAAARSALQRVDAIGAPGFVFRDSREGNAQGPELVVIAADLAMQRRLVTRKEFAEWWRSEGRHDAASKSTACRDRESVFRSSRKRTWQEPGFSQDDRHPVVCVSFAQAAAYADWMSRKSGHRYRLPTAVEWAQIATRTPPASCANANLADTSFKREYDSRAGSDCDDGFAETSPVARFAPVAGVYDIDGNVREWVAVCGKQAPLDGHCREHGTRGRGWASILDKEDVSAIDSFGAEVTLNTLGFRLVRELHPHP